MFKRQFYALEHPSHRTETSSSSSSESDPDSAEAQSFDDASSPAPDEHNRESSAEEEFAKDHDGVSAGRSGRGVEEGDDGIQQNSSRSRDKLSNQWAEAVTETIRESAEDFVAQCVLVCKNVLKCRLCPKTLCLSTETMRAHLSSKKHARSLKHLEEGKLKIMLNSDGEEEEQGETHAERYARTLASAQHEVSGGTLKRKRNSGRQRQRKRAKRKAFLRANEETIVVGRADHRVTASERTESKKNTMKGARAKLKKGKEKVNKVGVHKKRVKVK